MATAGKSAATAKGSPSACTFGALCLDCLLRGGIHTAVIAVCNQYIPVIELDIACLSGIYSFQLLEHLICNAVKRCINKIVLPDGKLLHVPLGNEGKFFQILGRSKKLLLLLL